MDYIWQLELRSWLEKYKAFPVEFQDSAIAFFEKAFALINKPDKAWFGLHSSRASLVVGQLYVVAIHKSAGNDQGIWLLVDETAPLINGLHYVPVKSTTKSLFPLQWGLVSSYALLPKLLENRLLWESFYSASVKVNCVPSGVDRDTVQLKWGKKRLTEIFNQDDSTLVRNEMIFAERVKRASNERPERRRMKLALANKQPRKIKLDTWSFQRNPDVVAEVLYRANGICESCHQPAPFLKRSDNAPYLEVHHCKPLAEGGDDSIENAVALCPNCHRKAHYG